MTKAKLVLAEGVFLLDGVTVPAIRNQLVTALDEWYRLHPDTAPELWVSSELHPNVLWAIKQVCKSLPEPVKVYTEDRDKRTGRLA